jgi:hypothetical protein
MSCISRNAQLVAAGAQLRGRGFDAKPCEIALRRLTNQLSDFFCEVSS